jgi:SnoaL-like protein
VTQAKYLADLLALQVLSTNVAHHINRGDCDALADYFVDDAKYEEDTQTSKGRDAIVAWFRNRSDAAQASTRHIYSAVHVVIVDPRFARGSNLRVSCGARRWPHDPALASPIVYDVDDVYRLGVDEGWRIADPTEKSLR